MSTKTACLLLRNRQLRRLLASHSAIGFGIQLALVITENKKLSGGRATNLTGLIHPQDWVNKVSLNLREIDCATAVMLKILDGKCKMNKGESSIMTSLYDATKQLQGACLNGEYHDLITSARAKMPNLPESEIDQIYELRVLAETQISRPVMKAFKARLRKEHVLPEKAKQTE